MSLQDSIASELPFLRSQAESRMLSRASICRKTGNMTTDDRGLEVPEWATVHADLPVRVAGTAANSAPYRTLNIGGAELTIAARVLHFPAATTDLRDGDLAEITAGDTAGSVWQLIEADFQDQATARRVPAVATERPEEWS